MGAARAEAAMGVAAAMGGVAAAMGVAIGAAADIELWVLCCLLAEPALAAELGGSTVPRAVLRCCYFSSAGKKPTREMTITSS